MTSTSASLSQTVLPGALTGVDLLNFLKVPNSVLTLEHLLLTPSMADDNLSRRASLIAVPPHTPITSFLAHTFYDARQVENRRSRR